MRFEWEESDFNSEKKWWGMLATKGEETVIIGGLCVTSLRDGHSWSYSDAENMAKKFNKHGYIPVFQQVNASVILKDLIEKDFYHGHPLEPK